MKPPAVAVFTRDAMAFAQRGELLLAQAFPFRRLDHRSCVGPIRDRLQRFFDGRVAIDRGRSRNPSGSVLDLAVDGLRLLVQCAAGRNALHDTDRRGAAVPAPTARSLRSLTVESAGTISTGTAGCSPGAMKPGPDERVRRERSKQSRKQGDEDEAHHHHGRNRDKPPVGAIPPPGHEQSAHKANLFEVALPGSTRSATSGGLVLSSSVTDLVPHPRVNQMNRSRPPPG